MRPYSSVCYEKFFYAKQTGVSDDVSQTVEGWLNAIESEISRRLGPIVAKLDDGVSLNSVDKYILSVLCSMLWLRGPKMRELANSLLEGMTRKLMSLNAEHAVDSYIADREGTLQPIEREELVKFAREGKYNFKPTNVMHISFMVDTLGFGKEGFANLFLSKNWTVFRAKSTEKFITSDSPVVEWMPPARGLFGITFGERTHVLALSPDYLLVLDRNTGSTEIKFRTIDEPRSLIVSKYNYLIANHSHKYAFSQSKQTILALLDESDHTYVDRMVYWNEFVKPHSIKT